MMERKLVKTDDGSHTLHVPGLGEHYHSIHGAVTESTHIFIRAGLEHISLPAVRILEYGLGTGLNMMLTYCRAAERGIKVYYHAIEKYPVIKTEAEQLNLSVACGMED
ncbi:MAG TPA: SAM-dependent methyltransferase, partial [Bacteroidales bacterium]|nr:SAM-dependent methyltransferase [Bacteroidales bacterium]